MKTLIFCLLCLLIVSIFSLKIGHPKPATEASQLDQPRTLLKIHPWFNGHGEQTVATMITGIKALEFRAMKLTDSRRLTIAKAAYAIAKKVQLDPYLLIALARQESDFTAKPNYSIRCRIPGVKVCQADCGITQHNIWGSPSWIRSYCGKLRYNHELAFNKSATEIKGHITYCKKVSAYRWHRPFWRCVLNRYNQGPFYKRRSQCTRHNLATPFMDAITFKRIRRKCLSRAAYWKSVLCFYYGARTGKRLRLSCRLCQRLNQIGPIFYRERGVKTNLLPILL